MRDGGAERTRTCRARLRLTAHPRGSTLTNGTSCRRGRSRSAPRSSGYRSRQRPDGARYRPQVAPPVKAETGDVAGLLLSTYSRSATAREVIGSSRQRRRGRPTAAVPGHAERADVLSPALTANKRRRRSSDRARRRVVIGKPNGGCAARPDRGRHALLLRDRPVPVTGERHHVIAGGINGPV